MAVCCLSQAGASASRNRCAATHTEKAADFWLVSRHSMTVACVWTIMLSPPGGDCAEMTCQEKPDKAVPSYFAPNSQKTRLARIAPASIERGTDTASVSTMYVVASEPSSTLTTIGCKGVVLRRPGLPGIVSCDAEPVIAVPCEN